MKNIIKDLQKGIIIGVGMMISVGLIGITYATWVDISDVSEGQTLSSLTFNNLIGNVEDIKTTVNNLPTPDAGVPVGTILPWHKDLTGIPTLPDGWVECNGSAISDVDSPINGQNTPNLNDQVYAGGKGYYLRGGNTSGLINPSSAWDDNGSKYLATGGTRYGGGFGSYVNTEVNVSKASYSTSPLNPDNFRFQVAAMTVVYIMKIK